MRLKEILVVLCNGISDIGKGWLTASLGALDPENTLPIKIDPLLNNSFPQHLGISINDLCKENPEDVMAFINAGFADSAEFKISEDMQTYKDAGWK